MKVMVNTTLPDNRKTWRLARLLNLTEYATVGVLVTLWCKVMRHAPNGDLTGWTSHEIARAATWAGDPELLVSSLAETGFIEGQMNTWRVHDWIDEQGDVLHKRNLWKERQKRYREGKAAKEHEPVPVGGTVETTLCNAWAKSGGWPISKDKGAQMIRAAIDRGADPQKIESMFWNTSECKGRKIWEVLDPLCPGPKKRTWLDVIDELKAKEA